MHPILLSTWSFGPVASAAGYPLLLRDPAAPDTALSAAIAAAAAVEADPAIDSVGFGGLPDAAGRVTLDACVMTNPDRCGSVACLQRTMHAAAAARAVMDKTPHVMLVGDGADAFAAAQGFANDNFLTPTARAAWEKWRANHPDALPKANWEEHRPGTKTSTPPSPPVPPAEAPHTHDTIGILARDAAGHLAGVCTTSGMAFKLPGRVGDSPIIGAGLYVDQTAGAAAATGTGELVMGVCGTFLAVELMRQGQTPLAAITAVLQRIASRYALKPEHQVALIAMNPAGDWASAALRPGFSHTITDEKGVRVEPAQRVIIPH